MELLLVLEAENLGQTVEEVNDEVRRSCCEQRFKECIDTADWRHDVTDFKILELILTFSEVSLEGHINVRTIKASRKRYSAISILVEDPIVVKSLHHFIFVTDNNAKYSRFRLIINVSYDLWR